MSTVRLAHEGIVTATEAQLVELGKLSGRATIRNAIERTGSQQHINSIRRGELFVRCITVNTTMTPPPVIPIRQYGRPAPRRERSGCACCLMWTSIALALVAVAVIHVL